MVRAAAGCAPDTVEAVAEAVTHKACNGRDSACDLAQYPDQALCAAGITYEVAGPKQGAFSQAALEDQISTQRKPVEVFWVYADTRRGGHVALVAGCDPASQSWWLLDPYDKGNWVTYNYLSYYTGGATWTATYYGLAVRA